MSKKKAPAKKTPAKKSASEQPVEVSIPVPVAEATEAEQFAASIHKKFADRDKHTADDLQSFDSTEDVLKAVGTFFKDLSDKKHFSVEIHSTEDGAIHLHTATHGKR